MNKHLPPVTVGLSLRPGPNPKPPTMARKGTGLEDGNDLGSGPLHQKYSSGEGDAALPWHAPAPEFLRAALSQNGFLPRACDGTSLPYTFEAPAVTCGACGFRFQKAFRSRASSLPFVLRSHSTRRRSPS